MPRFGGGFPASGGCCIRGKGESFKAFLLKADGSMLESAIRKHWLAWPPLARVVPADRVAVGWVAEGKRPYCTIARSQSQPVGHTSSGTTVTEHEVRFRIVADELTIAERIARQIEARFHRSDLEGLGGNLLLMQRSSGTRERQPEGPWLLVETYRVKEHLQDSQG